MLRLFVVLLSVVFMGCLGFNDVAKDDVSDVADCYEGTVAVDDRYGIVLDKDCMDVLLLSAGQKIVIDTESIKNAEEVGGNAEEAPETEGEVIETDAPVLYPCPIEDRGDWALLARLERNNFNLPAFRVPAELIDPITQAYVDQKDFLFIIYEPAILYESPIGLGSSDRAGGLVNIARYYLESPGLLNANALIIHNQAFHFVDPQAVWFRHWYQHGDRTQSGFVASFDTTPTEPDILNPKIRARKFWHAPEFGASLFGSFVGDIGAPEIRELIVLDIYVR